MLFRVCITPELSFKSFELFVEMSILPEMLLGPELFGPEMPIWLSCKKFLVTVLILD